MGIVYESQLHIQCDRCLYWESTSLMRKADWAKDLRKKGWKIGKVTLCPKCSGKKEEPT